MSSAPFGPGSMTMPGLLRHNSLEGGVAKTKIGKLMEEFDKTEEPADVPNIQKAIIRHLSTTMVKIPRQVDSLATYLASAYSVRDRLIQKWNETQEYHERLQVKRVYYMSMEFLLGRSLDNSLLALGLKKVYSNCLEGLGFNMEDCLEEELNAGLGNGGLGRLAACYVDSLATMDYPGWGYGLRYEYGMFKQKIVDGYQKEVPDNWLADPNPWELPRPDICYPVRFYGHVTNSHDANGTERHVWEGGQVFEAMAYDVPVPGYDTNNVTNIRLWSCKKSDLFDLGAFNDGHYEHAMSSKLQAENLTAVLYPNDNHMVGKELRLKQEFLFASATLQDIIARFKKTGRPWPDFPKLVAIQLNDTHPTLGVPELQRLLVDEEGLTWDEAWDIVNRTFSFTNHTVLPEAMERWPVPMLEKILPRHMSIIYDMNLFFLQKVEKKFPNDRDLLRRISAIEEGSPQNVRMAFLACIASHTVNGVAEIHSNIIKKTIFRDFIPYFGSEKFVNKTNGIAPRRWLHQANPQLSALITEVVGDKSWIKDLRLLKQLEDRIGDRDFEQRWMTIKLDNKRRLAAYIEKVCQIKVNPEAFFDVQVKRIHEYKRQFMNILGVIHRYNTLRAMSETRRKNETPRVVIFSGKAASGYYIAKLIIKLINSVAAVVNEDPAIGDLLKVVFIPDYNVSVAEVIIPASDISQHISTAGTEASGTSNMKFVLNGGVILGTVDGANVEICEEIGEDNIFNFGCLADEVEDFRHTQRYRPVSIHPSLKNVLTSIESGTFGDPGVFAPLLETLRSGGDVYLISIDFPSYLEALKAVDRAYRDPNAWVARSIRCTAHLAKFSSDRAIHEYATEIWNVKPCPVPSKP
ncbi:Non-essential glycogen phosphorylase [Dimargaris cristalligena]|uniref:Alpha-1,4 glucan phosphorylase n=1 Tax=Dimargaris cristalligena TaxID=215637 RepID=A0A4P9ZNI3_9FUNG|nr:Non-essential glycogen phosphorylase [Dimargaris cristalligena]RKP34974.1 glycosyl transferase [Dimargaris cristalligena]|eukprot:RKP34974.1 glycosyl transferase [Dimargaris cristalligena]